LVFFEIAYQAYVPGLVERRDLVDANAKLEIGRSTAEVTGPALAGALVQAIRAAPAILVDALSYVVSILSLLAIRQSPPRPARNPGASRPRFTTEVWEGVRTVTGNPTLRLIAGCTATSNLSSSMVSAVFLIYAYQRLRLSPGEVGIVFGLGGAGALL